MNLNDNSSCAFPAWELNGQGKPEMTEFGMTLRDYFAAKNMATLITIGGGQSFGPDSPDTNLKFARVAYVLADAMLKVREEIL